MRFVVSTIRLKPTKKKIVGGNISRNSCRKKAPVRRANPADAPVGAAATSTAGVSRSSRTGMLRIGFLPERSSPFPNSMLQPHLHDPGADCGAQRCVIALGLVGIGERELTHRLVELVALSS